VAGVFYALWSQADVMEGCGDMTKKEAEKLWEMLEDIANDNDVDGIGMNGWKEYADICSAIGVEGEVYECIAGARFVRGDTNSQRRMWRRRFFKVTKHE
jgi:hypothetical protein